MTLGKDHTISHEEFRKKVDNFKILESAWLNAVIGHDQYEAESQRFQNSHLIPEGMVSTDSAEVKEACDLYKESLAVAVRSLNIVETIAYMAVNKTGGDDQAAIRSFYLKAWQDRRRGRPAVIHLESPYC